MVEKIFDFEIIIIEFSEIEKKAKNFRLNPIQCEALKFQTYETVAVNSISFKVLNRYVHIHKHF